MKTGVELTRSTSEPEPVTTPSSHHIANDVLQHLPTEMNPSLPYNETITLQQQEHQIKSKTQSDESAKYDYTGIIGYQPGDPTSKDRFTFFKRKNIHTALQHPFSPDQVPYVDGYDNETLDFRYVRFMATKNEIDMLPWSERREFDGFKPGKVLDVGCEISAPWICAFFNVFNLAAF